MGPFNFSKFPLPEGSLRASINNRFNWIVFVLKFRRFGWLVRISWFWGVFYSCDIINL